MGLVARKAVVQVDPPKDNTPISRRVNRMLRVAQAMKNLKEGPKYDQLKTEYDAHEKELKDSADALKLLNELLSR